MVGIDDDCDYTCISCVSFHDNPVGLNGYILDYLIFVSAYLLFIGPCRDGGSKCKRGIAFVWGNPTF